MVNPDIFNNINLGSETSTATGSSFDVSRITRKSVFISALTNGSGAGTGSQLFVAVDFSHNGTDWQNIDTQRYESGTAVQSNVISYEEHTPFIRTRTIGSNVGTFNVSTIVTGRGV